MNIRAQWRTRVGSVFHVNARDGSVRNTVWLPRKESETKFSDALSFSGHICVDGPSGTGKTSLVLTGLNREKCKYVYVQIYEDMNWTAFCQGLVTPPSTRESSFSAELDVGLTGVVPTGRLQVSLATAKRPSDSAGLSEKIALSWTEQDVCQMLSDQKVVLFVDDFEYATEELIKRIANMCKLLVGRYASPTTKIIAVGASDIYRRLHKAKPALESRLEEISLGTLPNANASWRFLQMGFEKLGLTHPGNSKYVSLADNRKCVRAVYEAADGLPKVLNVLGRKIGMKGYDRKQITPADVSEIAEELPQEAIPRFRQEFTKVMTLVEESAAIRIVLHYLWEHGIGQIHYWKDVLSALNGQLPEEQLEVAIQQLVSAKFLIQTGKLGDVLFVVDPSVGHTLGVVISDPKKYGQRPEKYSAMGQLTLPFRTE